MGDAQAEAEINMAMMARRAALKRQKVDTQDIQLKRAVRRETRAFTESAMLPTKGALEDMSRVWRRICASAIRGGSSSASLP